MLPNLQNTHITNLAKAGRYGVQRARMRPPVQQASEIAQTIENRFAGEAKFDVRMKRMCLCELDQLSRLPHVRVEDFMFNRTALRQLQHGHGEVISVDRFEPSPLGTQGGFSAEPQ